MGLLDMLSNPAIQQGMLAAGLGTLASNTGGVSGLSALGRGGLLGMNAYAGANEAARQQKMDEMRMQQAQQQMGLQDAETQMKQQQLVQAQREQDMKARLLGQFLPGMFPTPAQAATPAQTSALAGTLGGAQGAGGADLIPAAVPQPAQPGIPSDLGGAAPGTGVAGPGAVPGAPANVAANPFFSGLTDDQKSRMALDYVTTGGKNMADIAKPNIQVQNGMVIDLNKLPPGTSLPTAEGLQYRPIPGQPGKYMVEQVQGMAGVQQGKSDIEHSHDMVEIIDPSGSGNTIRVPANSPMAQGVTKQNPVEQARLMANMERDQKKLGTYQDQREAAPGQIANLDQLGQGLEAFAKTGQSPKGAAFEQTMKNWLPGYKSGDALAPFQLSNAMAGQLALELRNPASGAGMPGSMSDSDRTFLTSMVANPGTDINAARQMIAARQATYRRSIEVGNMASKWDKTYGGLSGRDKQGRTFSDALSEWSNQPENALFKPQKPGGQ
jgi:hypothetical protein